MSTPDPKSPAPETPTVATAPDADRAALDAALAGAAGALVGRILLGPAGGILTGLAGAGLRYLTASKRPASPPAPAAPAANGHTPPVPAPIPAPAPVPPAADIAAFPSLTAPQRTHGRPDLGNYRDALRLILGMKTPEAAPSEPAAEAAPEPTPAAPALAHNPFRDRKPREPEPPAASPAEEAPPADSLAADDPDAPSDPDALARHAGAAREPEATAALSEPEPETTEPVAEFPVPAPVEPGEFADEVPEFQPDAMPALAEFADSAIPERDTARIPFPDLAGPVNHSDSDPDDYFTLDPQLLSEEDDESGDFTWEKPASEIPAPATDTAPVPAVAEQEESPGLSLDEPAVPEPMDSPQQDAASALPPPEEPADTPSPQAGSSPFALPSGIAAAGLSAEAASALLFARLAAKASPDLPSPGVTAIPLDTFPFALVPRPPETGGEVAGAAADSSSEPILAELDSAAIPEIADITPPDALPIPGHTSPFTPAPAAPAADLPDTISASGPAALTSVSFSGIPDLPPPAALPGDTSPFSLLSAAPLEPPAPVSPAAGEPLAAPAAEDPATPPGIPDIPSSDDAAMPADTSPFAAATTLTDGELAGDADIGDADVPVPEPAPAGMDSAAQPEIANAPFPDSEPDPIPDALDPATPPGIPDVPSPDTASVPAALSPFSLAPASLPEGTAESADDDSSAPSEIPDLPSPGTTFVPTAASPFSMVVQPAPEAPVTHADDPVSDSAPAPILDAPDPAVPPEIPDVPSPGTTSVPAATSPFSLAHPEPREAPVALTEDPVSDSAPAPILATPDPAVPPEIPDVPSPGTTSVPAATSPFSLATPALPELPAADFAAAIKAGSGLIPDFLEADSTDVPAFAPFSIDALHEPQTPAPEDIAAQTSAVPPPGEPLTFHPDVSLPDREAVSAIPAFQPFTFPEESDATAFPGQAAPLTEDSAPIQWDSPVPSANDADAPVPVIDWSTTTQDTASTGISRADAPRAATVPVSWQEALEGAETVDAPGLAEPEPDSPDVIATEILPAFPDLSTRPAAQKIAGNPFLSPLIEIAEPAALPEPAAPFSALSGSSGAPTPASVHALRGTPVPEPPAPWETPPAARPSPAPPVPDVSSPFTALPVAPLPVPGPPVPTPPADDAPLLKTAGVMESLPVISLKPLTRPQPRRMDTAVPQKSGVPLAPLSGPTGTVPAAAGAKVPTAPAGTPRTKTARTPAQATEPRFVARTPAPAGKKSGTLRWVLRLLAILALAAAVTFGYLRRHELRNLWRQVIRGQKPIAETSGSPAPAPVPAPQPVVPIETPAAAPALPATPAPAPAPAAETSPSPAPAPAAESQIRPTLPPGSPEERALQVLEKLLAARTPAEAAPLIRPGRTTAAAMSARFPDGNLQPRAWSAISYESAQPPGQAGRPAWLFRVITASVPDGFPVAVEQEGERIQIDWQAFVQCRDRDLDRFFETPGSPPGEFYAVVRRAHYFGTTIPKEEAERSVVLQITSPNKNSDGGYAIIPPGSSIAGKAAEAFEWGQTYAPVVRLAWQGDRVTLTGIVRKVWIDRSG